MDLAPLADTLVALTRDQLLWRNPRSLQWTLGPNLSGLLGRLRRFVADGLTAWGEGRLVDAAEVEGDRVLVATDCLSEGVNLQEQFQARVVDGLVTQPFTLTYDQLVDTTGTLAIDHRKADPKGVQPVLQEKLG